MIFFQLVVIAATALAITFSLGYIVLRAVTNLTVKECLALAGACGMALQGAIAFIGFLLGFSGRNFFILTTVALFTIAIALLLRKPTKTEPTGNYSWLYLLIVFWTTLVGIQLFVLIYSGANWYGDWWMHYDLAKVYLGQQATDTIYFNRYIVSSRTPLFNLFSSYYLGLLGNQFSIYQLSSILPEVFLLAMIPLLLRPYQVTIAVILVAFNGHMNSTSIYPWPKILASLYVITAIYFYLDLRKNSRRTLFSQSAVGWGLSSGLAMLSHPSTLFYVAAMVADNIWINRHNFVNVLRQLLVPLSIAFVTLLPWILWGISEYGLPEFLRALSNTTGSMSTIERVMNAIGNLTSTLVPIPLGKALISFNTNNPIIGQIGNPWLRFYYNVLPGALNITITCLLLFEGVRRYFRKSSLQSILPNSLFLSVIVFGFLGGCLLQQGFNTGGLVGESMTPIVFLLLLVASEYFYDLGVKFRQLFLLILTGEFLISRGLHLVFLGIGHPFIWDDNLSLKNDKNLVFARDLMATPWPGFLITTLSFILLLVIGLKACSREQRTSN
jgi:hypothetical protein